MLAPRNGPGEPTPELKPLDLGNADSLRKGSFLIALGNPYNTASDGTASASWGILSNTTRRLTMPPEPGAETIQMLLYQPTLLQLDAKLNMGMSGGAVINLKGELVGLTTTGGSAEGYDAQAGYAIPMDDLGRRIVETLRQGKEVEYGFLGIRLLRGAANRVGGVEPGTPAAEGGLIFNDEIIEVNGMPANAHDGLSLPLSKVPVGEPVKLTIRRDGREIQTSVFLSKYPVAGEVIATNRPDPWRGIRVDYTSVLAGTIQSDAILSAMSKGCVSITEIQPGSPADDAGLRKGQVITEVAGQPIRTPEQFNEAVEDEQGPVKLTTELGPVTIPPR